jgi:hypothetical protein
MNETSVAQSIVEFFAPKVTLGKMVKISPRKRHAWFESNVGLIRKCVDSVTDDQLGNFV